MLETSIRDAMGKFDAPFGYAEGFDQTNGEYAGLIYAKAARKSSPRKGSLFAPTLRSSKCRACRPLRPVASPEGSAPLVRRTCSRRARPFADGVLDERGTAVCLSQPQRPSGCRSVVYPGRRPRRLSHRRLISLQVDVAGLLLPRSD